MSNSVLCENETDKKKFGFLVNSKFIENLRGNTSEPQENIKERIFRHDGVSIDKIVEYNPQNHMIVKITYYDYFNNEKIKSVEEFESETGLKIRVTSFTLFKSITDYDTKTGHKIKTTNFDIKNPSKKTSVYDFDIETEKIRRITVFRADGNSVSMVKELDPSTGMVTRSISYKKDSTSISSVSKYDFQGDKTVKTTFYYNTPVYFTNSSTFDKKVTADILNNKVLDNANQKRMTRLIDNLYKNKLSFSSLSV